MQKYVNLVDLVKSFPTNIFLQNLASIQKRTNPLKFAHLAEKSEQGSTSNRSTKAGGGEPDAPRGRDGAGGLARGRPGGLLPRNLRHLGPPDRLQGRRARLLRRLPRPVGGSGWGPLFVGVVARAFLPVSRDRRGTRRRRLRVHRSALGVLPGKRFAATCTALSQPKNSHFLGTSR